MTAARIQIARLAVTALLAALSVLHAGCSSPPSTTDDCTTACADDGSCAAGRYCGDDDFCHVQGVTPAACEPLACATDDDCGGATCYCDRCSYVDAECPSGRRYSTSGSDEVAGSCIETAALVDSQFNHTCVVRTDGTVWCWGENCSKQLGVERAIQCDFTQSPFVIDSRNAPVQVHTADGTPLTDIIDVAAGAIHTCALSSDGQVWCWGSGTYGQLGDGQTGEFDGNAPTTSYESAGAVAVDLSALTSTKLVNIEAGLLHTCGRDDGGDIWCWGDNQKGQVGQPLPATVIDRSSYLVPAPTRVRRPYIIPPVGDPDTEDTGPYIYVDAGGEYTCAIHDYYKGSEASVGVPQVHCWGRNNLGQLGNNQPCGLLNENGNRTEPVMVLKTTTPRLPTGTHLDNSCAPEAPVCEPLAGNCGVTEYDTLAEPLGRAADSPPGVPLSGKPRVLGLGNRVTCAGMGFPPRLYCWGENKNLALGIESDMDNITAHVAHPNLLQPNEDLANQDVEGLAAGEDFACALMSPGTLHCWGSNNFGQMLLEEPTPIRPSVTPTITGIAQVTAGLGHICALTLDQELLCWGDNGSGKLGTGTDVAISASPLPVVPFCPGD